MLSLILLVFAQVSSPSLVTHLQDAYPAISPDGQSMVFQSTRNGRWALYLSDADGDNIRPFLDSGDDPVTASWSPDGRLIAFAATIEGQSEIFVINRDGSDRRRLTNHPGDDSHPHFGRDGRIYFNSPRATPDPSVDWSQQYHDIYSMEADGSRLRRHTECRTVCTFPSPSPDGRWLAYRKVVSTPGRNWDQSQGERNSEIFVARLDGSGERNISQHPAFDGWPVWSPDGRWIAFASNRDSPPLTGQIYLVSLEGTGTRRITEGPFSNVQPSFTPDGRAVMTYMHVEIAEREAGGIARWPVPQP